MLAFGRFGLGLSIGPLRTLAFFAMVIDAQATVYAIRDRRRLWSSRPSVWVIASSVLDIGLGVLVALTGWLTPPLGVGLVVGLIAAAAAFTFVLDAVKAPMFRRLGIA